MLNASTPREINEAFATVRQQRAGALYVGGDPLGSYVPILLQKSKVAGHKIFGENTKQRAIADSYDLNRATEVACEFCVRP